MNAAHLLPRTCRFPQRLAFFFNSYWQGKVEYVHLGKCQSFWKPSSSWTTEEIAIEQDFSSGGKQNISLIRPRYKLRCGLTLVYTSYLVTWRQKCWQRGSVHGENSAAGEFVSVLNLRNFVKASSRSTVKLVVVISFRPTPFRPWDLDVSVTISQFIQ